MDRNHNLGCGVELKEQLLMQIVPLLLIGAVSAEHDDMVMVITGLFIKR